MYIKNTQTQVHELYGWGRKEKSRKNTSSCKEAELLTTSGQVDALHKKIENEIGKLKNFRRSFLKGAMGHPENLMQTFNLDNSSMAPNWEEVLDLEIGSPKTRNRKPKFRTMCVMSSPRSNSSIELYSKPVSAGTDSQRINSCNQPIPRMCGGCNNGCCDEKTMAYSVYQRDFCNMGGASECRMADCYQHCYPSNSSYISCNMPTALPGPVPCSPNCQCPVGSVCQQVDMLMPQGSACEVCNSRCNRKRTTDLHTADFCCNWYPEPAAALKRSLKSKREPLPKYYIAPQQPNLGSSKEKGKIQSPPKSVDKIIKISFRKQKTQINDTKKIDKEKMIIKKYVPVKKQPENMDEIHMHRKYMEMYNTENNKTAIKDSSQNESEINVSQTYTNLPVQMVNRTELATSYNQGLHRSLNRNPITATTRNSRQGPVERVRQLRSVDQIKVTGSNKGAQSTTCKRKTLCIKRNDQVESVSRIKQDSDNIIVHFNRQPIVPENQVPPVQPVSSHRPPRAQTDDGLNRPQIKHLVNNQFCQTPKNLMPSGSENSSHRSKIQETQTDIQLTHPRIISNQSSQTSPRNRMPYLLMTSGYSTQLSHEQQTQTNIRDDEEERREGQTKTPSLNLNSKKASTFREQTAFTETDRVSALINPLKKGLHIFISCIKQRTLGTEQENGPYVGSARNASKFDNNPTTSRSVKSQITQTTSSARICIPWNSLSSKGGSQRKIKYYKPGIRHKLIQISNSTSTCKLSKAHNTTTPNHSDSKYEDFGGQTSLPVIPANTKYKCCLEERAEINNQATQATAFRSTKNVISSDGSVENKALSVHTGLPDSNQATGHTEQRVQCSELCDEAVTFENKPSTSTSHQKPIIHQISCTVQGVREKRRRSVTFQDERELSNRSVVYWEQLSTQSMEQKREREPEQDPAFTEERLYDNGCNLDLDLLDSYSKYEICLSQHLN